MGGVVIPWETMGKKQQQNNVLTELELLPIILYFWAVLLWLRELNALKTLIP